MRWFRFMRDMAQVAVMATIMLFQVVAEALYAGYRRVRRTIILAGLGPAAVPALLRLEHLAWRLRSAHRDPWPNRVHRMRIVASIREARRELAMPPADGGYGVAGWRIRAMMA